MFVTLSDIYRTYPKLTEALLFQTQSRTWHGSLNPKPFQAEACEAGAQAGAGGFGKGPLTALSWENLISF